MKKMNEERNLSVWREIFSDPEKYERWRNGKPIRCERTDPEETYSGNCDGYYGSPDLSDTGFQISVSGGR